MKLCLIAPPRSYLVDPSMQSPLGLLYVAAAAEAAGHQVTILDLSGRPVHGATWVPQAEAYGITATTLDYARDVPGIAAAIRAHYPDAPVILGGPCSLAPEMIDYRLITTLVVGDGEHAICDLMKMIASGDDLPPVFGSMPVDVAAQGPPARHLWPGPLGGAIFAHGRRYFDGPSATITTSRGCPNACAFCANAALSGRRVRFRALEAVVEEMEQCLRDFNVHEFRFSDECFNVRPGRVREFCGMIRASRTLSGQIAWRVSGRVKPLDAELLADMHAAGCREMSVGVESADPEVLALNKKNISIADAYRALALLREAGITSRALFMVGLPGERPETLRLNLRFLLDAPYDLVALTVFAPVPGCDIYANPGAYRCEIAITDPREWNFYFFDHDGARRPRPFVRLWDYDVEEHASAMEAVRRAALGLGQLNRG